MRQKLTDRLNRMWHRSTIYHVYFRRSGFYTFLGKNSIKLGGILVAFALALLAFQHYVDDVGEFFSGLFSSMSTRGVLVLFFISETILGMIPPDFFILWAGSFDNPMRMVAVLAMISYAGGFTAYLIGRRISYTKKVNHYLNTKFKTQFEFLNKWGGFFVLLAAMFPMPYAIASLVAGVVRFPMFRFLFFGLARLLRFYLYALALFQISN